MKLLYFVNCQAWGLQKLGLIIANKISENRSQKRKWSSKLVFLNFFFCYFLTQKNEFESTILARFGALAFCQFTKDSNFISLQLTFDQKPYFLEPSKIRNPMTQLTLICTYLVRRLVSTQIALAQLGCVIQMSSSTIRSNHYVPNLYHRAVYTSENYSSA